MSKRVQIAVIREATLNAKPTETHYLAAGGLQISRKDAVALKGTTLYYKVMVDLGEITGGDFIPGRDVPVYLTDSDPVLAFQPQLLHLVSEEALIVPENVHPVPIKMLVAAAGIDPAAIPELVADVAPTPEAPAKRRPGRPRKTPIVDTLPKIPDAVVQEVLQEQEASIPEPTFEVVSEDPPAAQDDESTFLIEPTGAPARSTQPEFSFEGDEDEQPAPPPVRNDPESLGFEIEAESNETPDPVDVQDVENVPPPITRNSDYSDDDDDYSNVDTGMFDE